MATAFSFDPIGWEHIAERCNYSAARLAKYLAISRRQLERIVKSKFGHSPQRWMDTLRLAAAKQRLKDGQFVKSVAFDLGFRDLSHFSLWFKRHTGQGPRAFCAHQSLEQLAQERQSPNRIRAARGTLEAADLVGFLSLRHKYVVGE